MDELTKQNHDLNNLKARLTQENFDLQRQVQELDSSNAALAKAKGQLQHALDDTKSRLDEESRVRAVFAARCCRARVDWCEESAMRTLSQLKLQKYGLGVNQTIEFRLVIFPCL